MVHHIIDVESEVMAGMCLLVVWYVLVVSYAVMLLES